MAQEADNQEEPDFHGSPETPIEPTLTSDMEVVPSENRPKRIGPYHIKRTIATGGMGTVYEAVQEQPRRTVAVKLMRAGIASRSALRRFEYESQLLARLRHPGIAQVYQAGTHRDGEATVPYFAMEYIPNARTITDFAREKKLGTRERLKLFAQVCDAVHHGHQKGIIHRDLKPGNILADSNGQVKVIDFGVARSTDSDMAVTTLQTGVGQLIGTLQYMSPEQCDADPHDIDVRSDVYALGVVLYELLTGELPYDLRNKALHEATRIIREAYPTRLSSTNRTLAGDVETISRKALEKERDRRYQSASDFGQDIERYLNNEPIAARRASMVYQLRVFARRHRAVVAMTVGIFVALTLGMVASTAMYLRAERARSETVLERDHAQQAKEDALAAADRARRTSKFLTTVLASADPHENGNPNMTVREMLDEAASKAHAELNDQPEVQADVFGTIGMAKRHLGQARAAEQILRQALDRRQKALGDEHELVAESFYNLAWAIHDLPDYPEAERACRAGLEMRRRLLGDDHPDVAQSLAMLGDLKRHLGDLTAAESQLDDALRIFRARVGDDDPRTLDALNDLALLYKEQIRFGEAEAVLRRVVEMRRRNPGDGHPLTLESIDQLGEIVGLKLGRLDEGEALLQEALAGHRKLYPNDDRHTAWNLTHLATISRRRGQWNEAEALVREALEMTRAALGPDHIDVAWQLQELSDLLLDAGKLDEAEEASREALRLVRRVLGATNKAVGWRLAHLSHILRIKGRLDESLDLARQRLELTRNLPIPDPKELAWSEWNLARSLDAKGEYVEAEALFRSAIDGVRREFGPRHPEFGGCERHFAAMLQNRGRLDEAEPLFRDALAIMHDTYGDDHSETVWRRLDLARLLQEKGELTEADRMFADAVSGARKAWSAPHFEIAQAFADHGKNLNRLGRFEEAEAILRECAAMRRESLGPEHWRVFSAMSLLGEAVSGLRRFDEAEPMLLEAQSRLAADPETPAFVRRDAVERLVAYFNARHSTEPDNGFDAKSAEWRAKLPASE